MNKRNLVIFLACALVGASTGQLLNCTQAEKQVAKTVVDVATDACREYFGVKPAELPSGISIQEFCAVQKNLQVFEDALLSASKISAARPPSTPADAGK